MTSEAPSLSKHFQSFSKYILTVFEVLSHVQRVRRGHCLKTAPGGEATCLWSCTRRPIYKGHIMLLEFLHLSGQTVTSWELRPVQVPSFPHLLDVRMVVLWRSKTLIQVLL
jgi:hypothetical protein